MYTKHFNKDHTPATTGINARVRKLVLCGSKIIQVYTPAPDAYFTAEEIHRIATIAQVNHLTGAMNSPIDPDHEARLTGKQTWNFEFHD